MKLIRVKLAENPYPVLIGGNIINSLGRHLKRLSFGRGSWAYVVTNSFIKRTYGARLASACRRGGYGTRFKLVPDSEKSKSMQVASGLAQDLASFDRNKRVFIIAFGGGVIGDLAGFVASIYKRGVAYIQVPTTLLAQVDSSIGGKTAVDLAFGKNLIGAFYQPRLVLSDTKFLGSLGQRQIRSGLAEVIKYGLIKDPALFGYLEKNLCKVFALEGAALEYIVSRSAAIKARIVGEDEKEKKGLRTALNFGHTIGHALEAAGKYTRYTHGEAVALGMLTAAGISREMRMLSSGACERIERLIKNAGLPCRISSVSKAAILKAYYHDKKFSGTRNKLVLLEGIGRVRVKEGVPLEVIKKAIAERMK